MKNLLITITMMFTLNLFAQDQVKMTEAMNREFEISIYDFFADLPVKNIAVESITKCQGGEECEYFIDSTIFARSMGSYSYITYECWTTINKEGRRLVADTTTCEYYK